MTETTAELRRTFHQAILAIVLKKKTKNRNVVVANPREERLMA